MDDVIRRHLLRYIAAVWEQRGSDTLPWGLWIAHHAPITEANATYVSSPLCAAWFLDARGLRPHDVWEYARFRAVHLRWRSAIFGKVHEIGVASFAPYADGNDVYIEMVWGGLDAVGQRVMVDAERGVDVRRTLWVS